MSKACGVVLAMLFSANLLVAQVSLTGTVTRTGGTAGIPGVKISLANVTNLSVTTDSLGAFTLNSSSFITSPASPQATSHSIHYALVGTTLAIASLRQMVNGKVELFSNDGRTMASIRFNGSATGKQNVVLPEFRSGLTILRVSAGGETFTGSIIRIGDAMYLKRCVRDVQATTNFSVSKTLATSVDTIIAVKTGYVDKKVAIDSYTKQNIAITLDTLCIVPAMPTVASLTANAKLPDPFKFMNGTRMTRKDQWACRRAEISALAQTFLYGRMPPKPQKVSGTLKGDTLTVSVTDKGKTISFPVILSKPTTGTAPYPALINTCGNNLGSPKSMGIAEISFPCLTIGSETRGQGLFFTLYSSDTLYSKNGNLITHAWGVDRLIDVLETMISQTGIDPARLAITGCSRNGKSALSIGAFCERIALTLPQESGAGGTSNWRMAENIGAAAQRLSSTVTEAAWLSTTANQFTTQVNKIPLDQHMIVALCAPRPILIIDNIGYDWLCPKCNVGTATAASMVYQALGISDRMGLAQPDVTHTHCSFPSSQQATLNAYYTKFLLMGTATTGLLQFPSVNAFTQATWIDWTVPALQ